MNEHVSETVHEPSLAVRAGGILFASGNALKYSALAKMLACTESELQEALGELQTSLEGSGMALVKTDTSVAMATAPDVSETVSAIQTKTLEGEIGQAGLEVLAIVLYRGPSTRATIDYIRGVNSSATIRNLVARGIVERVRAQDNAREFVYRPTADMLAHLGAERVETLPDYASIQTDIAAFEARSEPKKEQEHGGDTSTIGNE